MRKSTRRQPRILLSAVLAALLVAAEITALGHFDLDGHSRDAPCAICLSLASFAGADVAKTALNLPEGHSPKPCQACPVLVAPSFFKTQLARAPPLVS